MGEKVDILMDLGTQLDAAIDIGQLGLGYVLCEELKVNPKGVQINLGTYEIPGAYDTPIVFNCSLLKDSPNPVGVKGSKLCAEPAMGLVSSTFLAIKRAMYAAREDAGLGGDWFDFGLPATPEKILMAIGTPQDKLIIPD